MRAVTVLGSTGSIGRQTLDVVAASPERFRVEGLAAGSNDVLLAAQARAHGARRVALADEQAAQRAREALAGGGIEVLGGPDGVVELAGAGETVGGDDHVVLNGMDGSRGLQPTLAVLHSGARLALANKESLIVGGDLVRRAARPGQLLPVDSEHSALAQCLLAGAEHEVARLVVTASGGPFRGRKRKDLEGVTVTDALAHPTWAMGPVITVNSATLANKGLEVIEAHLLFGVPYDRIDVVVHPQSIVHSMVEFTDGATVAKLSPPDMRLPIQLALAWPERLDVAPARMDWTRQVSLEFEPLDAETFPMVELARGAGLRGGTAPAALNAANEVAVAAFLAGDLPFLGITDVVAAVLSSHVAHAGEDLEGVLAAEGEARAAARTHIAAYGHR